MKIVKIAVEAEGGTAQGGVQISVKYGMSKLPSCFKITCSRIDSEKSCLSFLI